MAKRIIFMGADSAGYELKENNLVIETGTDRTRMLITRWAVQQNNSAMERLAAEREAAKAAQEKAKAEKKAAKSKKNED